MGKIFNVYRFFGFKRDQFFELKLYIKLCFLAVIYKLKRPPSVWWTLFLWKNDGIWVCLASVMDALLVKKTQYLKTPFRRDGRSFFGEKLIVFGIASSPRWMIILLKRWNSESKLAIFFSRILINFFGNY